MTAEKFCEIMTDFRGAYDEAETILDRAYTAFGDGAVEAICEASYSSILIKTLSAVLTDNEEKAESIADDIAYLIYECEFNLELYCKRVEIEGKHPIITTFEDYYYYLIDEGGAVEW